MGKISFPFQCEDSPLFRKIYRPVAKVEFWSFNRELWETIPVIVDSGADYTLLPRYLSRYLGIDPKRDCTVYPTSGIGGTERVFLFRKMPIRIAQWQSKIPVGFLNHDDVPPLLGRQDCLEKFGVVFHKRRTLFIF